MSIRCQVGILPCIDSKIEDCKLFLFKHHDGYPDYMLPLLKKHVEEYLDRNYFNYDEKMMSSWVFFELMYEYVECVKKQHAAHEDEKYKPHGRNYNEFTFDSKLIEYTNYVYAIYPDRIEVREGGGWDIVKSKHKVIGTVAITRGPPNAEREVDRMTYEIPDMF